MLWLVQKEIVSVHFCFLPHQNFRLVEIPFFFFILLFINLFCCVAKNDNKKYSLNGKPMHAVKSLFLFRFPCFSMRSGDSGRHFLNIWVIAHVFQSFNEMEKKQRKCSSKKRFTFLNIDDSHIFSHFLYILPSLINNLTQVFWTCD